MAKREILGLLDRRQRLTRPSDRFEGLALGHRVMFDRPSEWNPALPILEGVGTPGRIKLTFDPRADLDPGDGFREGLQF